MQKDLLIIVLIGLSVIFFGFTFLILKFRRLESRFLKALGGSRMSSDLEATLVAYFDKLNATETKLDQIRSQYGNLQQLVAQSYQKLGFVRFNPFRDTGGDQSFAICLLDNQDSGLVLTAVHGRQGTRIYAKPIEYGQSQSPLSEEEKKALRSAQTVKRPVK